jgi:hypothetical protein
MSADQVAPLCDLALPKPASAGSRGGALAIALHCLMVREGENVFWQSTVSKAATGRIAPSLIEIKQA